MEWKHRELEKRIADIEREQNNSSGGPKFYSAPRVVWPHSKPISAEAAWWENFGERLRHPQIANEIANDQD
jgi:hypothetical protein